MLRPLFLLLSLLTALSLPAQVQQETTWEELLEEWFVQEGGNMDEGETGEGSLEALSDMLADMAATPLDLNKATREELEQLPFLTDKQVEDIMAYVDRYGPVRSMGEVAMIPSIDARQRQLLSCFVTVNDDGTQQHMPRLADILRHGRQELTATLRTPLYRRQGDKNGYLGYPYRHWLRYDFSYGGRVRAGLVASQDAGEPFFGQYNRMGYDNYSPYIIVKGLGCVKALAAGRYRLHLGMGLVLNNDFTLGKQGALQSMRQAGNTIRPHSSRSIGNYMQGVAATVNITPQLAATAFASYRPIDATLADGSTITTILTSGYHRTQSEIDRKHNATQTAAGGRIGYTTNSWHIGATAVTMVYNKELLPDTRQPYRRYYPAGQRFTNAAADYGLRTRRLTINGETATDGSALATVNMATMNLTGSIDLTAIQRYYSYRYQAPLANAFRSGSRTQNESGVYVGGRWRPSRLLTITAYGDIAYHPWARYLVSQASYDHDYFLAAQWQKAAWAVTMSGRLLQRQRDNDDKTLLINRNTGRLRLAVSHTTDRLTLNTQGDVTLAEHGTRSIGYMILQKATWKMQRLTAHAMAALFHTNDYDSRVYAYERGLRYEMNFPAFFGHGLRTALLIQLKAWKNTTLAVKAANTHYFDRTTIGTALQRIDSRNQTDIDMQARIVF